MKGLVSTPFKFESLKCL